MLNKLSVHNFFVQMFFMWVVDQKRTIYATTFDLLVFAIVYFYQSVVISSQQVIAEYIKRVMLISQLTFILGNRNSNIIFFIVDIA